MEPMTMIFESRIPGAMADQPCSLVPGLHGSRAPDESCLFIPQVNRFSRQIHLRIISPGGETIFTAILTPGEAASGLRHEEAKLWIGYYIDPRMRGCLTGLQENHIFLPVRTEPAQPIIFEQISGPKERRSWLW